MPNDVQAAMTNAPKPEALYAKLEDRILARDQVGASEVYYDLVRERRPMKEIIAEAVRIHAPYTHVPYHERIDDGYVNFVNNDHCLLSARAATQLARMVPEDCAALRDRGVSYIVVEQNLALARDVRSAGVPVIYGDAGWPEVLGAARPEVARLLIVAIPERGNVRRIVQTAREANPTLPVIVRTHSEGEAEWLRGQAIERVVMSEHRTAMDIARYAMETLDAEPPETGERRAEGGAA